MSQLTTETGKLRNNPDGKMIFNTRNSKVVSKEIPKDK
jgi:hypothetical protein